MTRFEAVCDPKRFPEPFHIVGWVVVTNGNVLVGKRRDVRSMEGVRDDSVARLCAKYLNEPPTKWAGSTKIKLRALREWAGTVRIKRASRVKARAEIVRPGRIGPAVINLRLLALALRACTVFVANHTVTIAWTDAESPIYVDVGLYRIVLMPMRGAFTDTYAGAPTLPVTS